MNNQQSAHAKVYKAVAKGDLPKLDGSIVCVDCGGEALHYDHRDYKKPLEVEPVCRKCNYSRGSAKNKGEEGNIYRCNLFLAIPEEMKDQLKNAAKRDSRTLTGLIIKILRDFLEQNNP